VRHAGEELGLVADTTSSCDAFSWISLKRRALTIATAAWRAKSSPARPPRIELTDPLPAHGQGAHNARPMEKGTPSSARYPHRR